MSPSAEKCASFGLFPGDKGDNIDMWMIKITINANRIEMDALLISNVDKTMFVPKVRLFPLFYWFVNFTLTDKHGTKNLLGLIRPWVPKCISL